MLRGDLLFSGGITFARGHAGDNAGRTAIEACAAGQSPGYRQTPVFGCPIIATARQRVRDFIYAATIPAKVPWTPNVHRRADELFHEHQQRLFVRTDRMFATLLLFQWVAGIVAAIWISPRAWAGASSQVHPHVWAAIVLAGVVVSLPVRAGGVSTGQNADPTRDCHRPDVPVRDLDSSQRRTHRNALPRFWLAWRFCRSIAIGGS